MKTLVAVTLADGARTLASRPRAIAGHVRRRTRVGARSWSHSRPLCPLCRTLRVSLLVTERPPSVQRGCAPTARRSDRCSGRRQRQSIGNLTSPTPVGVHKGNPLETGVTQSHGPKAPSRSDGCQAATPNRRLSTGSGLVRLCRPVSRHPNGVHGTWFHFDHFETRERCSS